MRTHTGNRAGSETRLFACCTNRTERRRRRWMRVISAWRAFGNFGLKARKSNTKHCRDFKEVFFFSFFTHVSPYMSIYIKASVGFSGLNRRNKEEKTKQNHRISIRGPRGSVIWGRVRHSRLQCGPERAAAGWGSFCFNQCAKYLLIF